MSTETYRAVQAVRPGVLELTHKPLQEPGAWPRVPGWPLGQRVGLGFLGGACGCCGFCRGGDLINCRNQGYTGVHRDGGYAEVMIAKASGLICIPESLSSADAAPLLCAGLSTFSALANCPAKPGDLVAVPDWAFRMVLVMR